MKSACETPPAGHNLATFLRCIKLPAAMADWSLTSLQLKPIRIVACVVGQARTAAFQQAQAAIIGEMVPAICRRHVPAAETARE
jgi:hypothetical protein